MLCGAFLVMTLQIDKAKTVKEARFKVAGCMRLVKACEVVTAVVEGLSIAAASNWARSFHSQQAEFLDQPPEGRDHCAGLASAALSLAITSYSDVSREQWNGDDALICSCFGVSEQTIEDKVRAGRLASIEEVTDVCNAGGGCRSCYPLIQEILDAN
jgi:NifU-like protein